jgi:hypothetical protein
MDGEIAAKTKMRVERVKHVLTCGSREEKEKLLAAYVESIKKEFDRAEKVGDTFKVHH